MRDKKSLIIYFSRADENYAVGYIDKGNTEIVAEYVRDLTGADMFKVEPLVPYSKDYQTCIKEAKERIGNAPIKENLYDISQYEVIYIMTPIYWGTYAPELETAIKDLDFSGKIIRIITTHEGSGLANVVSDVKKICNGATVLDDAIAIKGSKAKEAESIIESWI
ncbi:MAG: NAD(P)H-dependent oxidoreductase [Bacilli bacterium]|nr:NAD(P)H-dependent oxidoreductase [Bacilli bacterium]